MDKLVKLNADGAAEAKKDSESTYTTARNTLLIVAALAIASTQKLIGESLDEKRQHALLDEFFSGVKSGKVTLLEKVGAVKGAGAEVTSALPLRDDEQETVRKDLLKAMGGAGDVVFKVDPNILGGLVIRVDDRVVDGSVAGQLQGLRQDLL